MNGEKLPKLKFCECYLDRVNKNNQPVTCSRIAEYTVLLSYPNTGNKKKVYRCVEHLHIPTKNSIVLSHAFYNQKEKTEKIQMHLKSLVGKKVPNIKDIDATGLVVKDNGILCKDQNSKYVFIFYDWVIVSQ